MLTIRIWSGPGQIILITSYSYGEHPKYGPFQLGGNSDDERNIFFVNHFGSIRMEWHRVKFGSGREFRKGRLLIG